MSTFRHSFATIVMTIIALSFNFPPLFAAEKLNLKLIQTWENQPITKNGSPYILGGGAGLLPLSDLLPAETHNYTQMKAADLLKLAQQGDFGAQYQLAYIYETGTKVLKNIEVALIWYKEAIKQYNPSDLEPKTSALIRLILINYDGKSVPPNYAEVKKYATLLSHHYKDTFGNLYLGKLYENGFGVIKDEQQALIYYLESITNNTDVNNALNTNPALYLVGNLYLDGRGTKADLATAITYFKRDKYGEQSRAALLKIYQNSLMSPTTPLVSTLVKQNNTKPLANPNTLFAPNIIAVPKTLISINYNELNSTKLIGLANEGDLNAQTHLALQYANGFQGQPQNSQKAFNWFEKAANAGQVSAQYNMAVSYLYGQNNQAKNPALAINWLKKSANGGDYRAQNLLGDAFFHGDMVVKNGNTAIYWYTLSANQFNPETIAKYNYQPVESLMRIYYEGKVVPQNFALAYYYAIIGALGPVNSTAYEYLGRLHQNGQGVSKNIPQAIEYYLISQSRTSYNNLADMYLEGNGVAMDRPKAIYYYKLAADKSSYRADGALLKLGITYQGK